MTRQSVAVVVDSTASLPPDIATQHAIHVVPMKLSFGAQSFRDGVDITPAEFYSRLARTESPPTTASPSPGDFAAAFDAVSAQGATNVLCLTLSSQLSSVYQSAYLGAQEARERLPSLRVQVLDTRTAGGAQGLVALGAARAAAQGLGLDQVAAAAQQIAERVHFLGVLDTLHYLWKGGRIPRAALWATSLLQIKPILEIRDGQVPLVERPRTHGRAIDRLLAIVARRASGRPVRAIVMHANAPDEAERLLARLRSLVHCEDVFTAPFTPVIGAHTGPGLLGIAFHTA